MFHRPGAAQRTAEPSVLQVCGAGGLEVVGEGARHTVGVQSLAR